MITKMTLGESQHKTITIRNFIINLILGLIIQIMIHGVITIITTIITEMVGGITIITDGIIITEITEMSILRKMIYLILLGR
jgi:hypothetical protein